MLLLTGGPSSEFGSKACKPRHRRQRSYRLAEPHHIAPSPGTPDAESHRLELPLWTPKPHVVALYERARTQVVLEHRVAPGGCHVERIAGQVRLVAMAEIFVMNGPHEAEVFGVDEDLIAGSEVYLVFVEGYATQPPGTTPSLPAYRRFVVAYDLLDRLGVQVYHVDASVALALMGGAHHGTRDYLWEAVPYRPLQRVRTAANYTHHTGARCSVETRRERHPVDAGRALRSSVHVDTVPFR